MVRRKKIRFFVRRNPKILIGAPKRQVIIPFRPLSILLIIALSVLSIYFALRSDIFEIRKIEVAGENNFSDCISEDDLIKKVDVIGKSAIFINENNVEKRLLSQINCVQNIQVSTGLPNKITIKVNGRRPIAAIIASKSATINSSSESANLSLDNEIYLVDSNAVFFKKVATISGLPKILVSLENEAPNESSRLKPVVQTSINIITSISQYQLSIEKVSIDHNLNIIAQIDNEIIIYFSNKKDAKEQAASLQGILRQAKIDGKKLKQIDLRFDRPHVVYK